MKKWIIAKFKYKSKIHDEFTFSNECSLIIGHNKIISVIIFQHILLSSNLLSSRTYIIFLNLLTNHTVLVTLFLVFYPSHIYLFSRYPAPLIYVNLPVSVPFMSWLFIDSDPSFCIITQRYNIIGKIYCNTTQLSCRTI